MKIKYTLAAIMLTTAASLTADELPIWHAGVHYSDSQFKPGNGAAENVNDLNLKLGKKLNPNVSVEVHLGTDVANNDSEGNGATYLAGFARKDYKLERINIFGLLGATVGAADYPGNFDDDFVGIAFGAGIELFGTPRTAVSFQFVQYGTDDSYKTIGAGLVHYFNKSDIR